VKFCGDLQTQKGATTNLYAQDRKGSFAGIFKPRDERRCRRNALKEVKFCGGLRTHREATPAGKQEAMNGTRDMARNPRIRGDAAASRQKQDKGDVTPNKKKE
jgi:hypothetical protein